MQIANIGTASLFFANSDFIIIWVISSPGRYVNYIPYYISVGGTGVNVDMWTKGTSMSLLCVPHIEAWASASTTVAGIQSVRLNTLRAKFYRGNINMYLFYVISPHWYDAGTWNPSSSKTRTTYIFYIVNIIAADVLAT